MSKAPLPTQKSKNIIRALMDPSLPDTMPWSSNDLRAILEHQLKTPLRSEVQCFAATCSWPEEKVSAIVSACGELSFGGLLTQGMSSVEALKFVKEFAKAALASGSDLPRDVARVLYVLAILKGRAAGAEDITTMDAANIEREARRCLTLGWLPSETGTLIRNAIAVRPS